MHPHYNTWMMIVIEQRITIKSSLVHILEEFKKDSDTQFEQNCHSAGIELVFWDVRGGQYFLNLSLEGHMKRYTSQIKWVQPSASNSNPKTSCKKMAALIHIDKDGGRGLNSIWFNFVQTSSEYSYSFEELSTIIDWQ